MPREIVPPKEISRIVNVRKTKYPSEASKKLYANLALPSYVHGYSLAIQYMYRWFESKFEKGFFKGGIYVDGKHVLDDYKHFSKNVVKGQNPRARIEPRIEYDYDRETVDTYLAPPDLYLRKSTFNESFFKDYDRALFLGLEMKALRMDFNFKVRVNTRAQQLDTYNRMQMYFRNGSTMHELLSVDFHIPKTLILNIALRAGFEVKNGEVQDIISFLSYLNSHSDLPFLYKIRAINQRPEFYIRISDLYTHINCTDKLSVDDGERLGKLDYNFHIEMNSILTIPIPHFYSFYSAYELETGIEVVEPKATSIPIYSINVFEIPNVDEHGWIRAAITDYMTDKGEKEIDLSPIFTGENVLSYSIQHTLTQGLSPYHFINIVIYRGEDIAKLCEFKMNWETFKAELLTDVGEEVLHIAVYYDREYINQLDISLHHYNDTRISNT